MNNELLWHFNIGIKKSSKIVLPLKQTQFNFMSQQLDHYLCHLTLSSCKINSKGPVDTGNCSVLARDSIKKISLSHNKFLPLCQLWAHECPSFSRVPLRPSWTSAKSASCYARSFIKNLCITSAMSNARAAPRHYFKRVKTSVMPFIPAQHIHVLVWMDA